MALTCKPRRIVADEATKTLDVTTQAQILRLMKTLQQETGKAMIFVTHDLSVGAEIANRVAVMHFDRIIETGPVDDIFDHHAHPYTHGLMDCSLRVVGGERRRRAQLEETRWGDKRPQLTSRPR